MTQIKAYLKEFLSDRWYLHNDEFDIAVRMFCDKMLDNTDNISTVLKEWPNYSTDEKDLLFQFIMTYWSMLQSFAEEESAHFDIVKNDIKNKKGGITKSEYIISVFLDLNYKYNTYGISYDRFKECFDILTNYDSSLAKRKMNEYPEWNEYKRKYLKS